jgi:hypothetical protein
VKFLPVFSSPLGRRLKFMILSQLCNRFMVGKARQLDQLIADIIQVWFGVLDRQTRRMLVADMLIMISFVLLKIQQTVSFPTIQASFQLIFQTATGYSRYNFRNKTR